MHRLRRTELFVRQAGLQMVHVPYKGAATA